MLPPWTLIPVAVLLAVAWWPLRNTPGRARWCGTLARSIALAALPAKLIDSAVAPEVWTGSSVLILATVDAVVPWYQRR